MQTGNRWEGNTNPRDLTRTRQQQLLKAKEARDEAASLDVNEVRREARLAGFRDGFDQGFAAGWDALVAYLVDQGVLDADDAEREEAGSRGV